jgi:hypothetical protein
LRLFPDYLGAVNDEEWESFDKDKGIEQHYQGRWGQVAIGDYC